jgi:O-antigen/teichoic acid export membrane protein
MTDDRTPHRLFWSGTAYMVIGTLVAAIAAYLFQLIAGRSLGPTDFAPVTVLWTIQFLAFTTVFMPIEQITIRRLSADEPISTPWTLYGSLIAVSAAASVVFGALTLDRLFDGEWAYLIVIGVLVAAYGGFALGRGYLAGNLRYREYGLSTMAESVLRLVVAIALLALGVGALGLGWTLAIGALVVFAWRPFRAMADRGHDQRPLGETASVLFPFIVANGASQTILAAGPLVVGAIGAPAAEVSVFFETFLLFRAPLTISYSLVARVLPPFTAFVERDDHVSVRRWSIRLAIAGVLAAAAAYVVGNWVGPDIVELMLGSKFRPTAELAALAAAGVAVATLALFTQQLLIARRATPHLAAAWLLGLTVAAVVVWLDGSSESIRVGRGFLAGEVSAFAGLIAATLRR